MRLHSLFVPVALALCAAMPGTASAGSGGSHFIDAFDANHDGAVTREEFDGASRQRFARIDADGNGKLTPEEFSTYVQARRRQFLEGRFQGLDTDHDGTVSKAEWLAAQQERAERRFARLDGNGDGTISANEYAGRKDRAAHARRGGGRIFAAMDTDKDGAVTQEESHAAWSRWFARLDGNGDGTVSPDELAQARRH